MQFWSAKSTNERVLWHVSGYFLVSLHEWHYSTTCQREHAEKLDWWNIWGAQEDILPGQSVCFHKNSVAINLPWDTQLKTWKYLTVKAIRPEHAKQEIKSIYKNWPSLTWLFCVCVCFTTFLPFFLPPCCIIRWFIWLYYNVSLSVLHLSVEFVFLLWNLFCLCRQINWETRKNTCAYNE